MAIKRTINRQTDFNPFFYKGIDIPEKYFCDREKETETLVKLIRNGNNVVLKAPRRIGKSSLIQHLFNQEELKDSFNTVYADIFSSRSSDDFISILFKALSDCETLSGKSSLKEMEKELKEISFDIELNIPNILKISRTSRYEILRLERTLDVMFKFLSRTKRPNLIVIDEFQQIRNYCDCDMESHLRTFIQRATNTCFIFSGSSKHMLAQIFDSPTKPFYKSSRSVSLDVIPFHTYLDFCKRQFSANGKGVDDGAVELTYNIFCGNTFMMQQTMNGIYQVTPKEGTASREDAEYVIESLVDEKAEDYRMYLHSLKPAYENVLLHIAREGVAEKMLSTQNNLGSSTTTANILGHFQRDETKMIEEIAPNKYVLDDKLFELWAAKYVFDNLESKFANAKELYETVKECRAVTSRACQKNRTPKP